jgi:hypothetical protein
MASSVVPLFARNNPPSDGRVGDGDDRAVRITRAARCCRRYRACLTPPAWSPVAAMRSRLLYGLASVFLREHTLVGDHADIHPAVIGRLSGLAQSQCQ